MALSDVLSPAISLGQYTVYHIFLVKPFVWDEELSDQSEYIVPMSDVDIFGTYHLDRPSKVKKELGDHSTEADVFFTEVPREGIEQFGWIDLALRNPAVLVAGKLLNVFWVTGGFLLTRRFDTVDSVVTEKIASERDMEMLPVDQSVIPDAIDVNPLTTILSWVWLLLASVVLIYAIDLWPNALLVYDFQLSSFFFISLAVLIAFVPILPLVYQTLGDRNAVIAENIAEILDEREGSSRGCLVVGHKHMDGVIEELEKNDVVVGKTHKSKFLRRAE